MSNLFSTFDPQSWMSLNLNWLASALIFILLPPIFWSAFSQPLGLLSLTLSSVTSEFKAITSPISNPGLVLVPISLFLLVLYNNALGLSPYIFTASSHLSFTIAMALPLWGGHMLLATIKTPTSMLAHLVPLGTPPALMPFMVLIELVSSLIRPLTLSVRLAANMIAGHLLLTLLANNGAPAVGTLLCLIIGALIALCTLECAVSMIQAYVFSVLSTLYLNEVNCPSLD